MTQSIQNSYNRHWLAELAHADQTYGYFVWTMRREWLFDEDVLRECIPFKLNRMTNRNTLICVPVYLIHPHNRIQISNIDMTKVITY